MKTFKILFILFLFITVTKTANSQIPNAGVFLGGGATVLLMNGNGTIEYQFSDIDFNVTKDIWTTDDAVMGWGWNNKFLLGLRPILGYRISPRISVLGSYNFFFKKKGNYSDSYFEYYDFPLDFEIETEYTQSTLQILCQFHPIQNKNFFLTAGFERVSMKMKTRYSHDEYYWGFDGFSDTSKDKAVGIVLGAGYEAPALQRNTTLTATVLYSLTKYAGWELYDLDDVWDMELNIGGLSAYIDMKVYIDRKKTQKEPLKEQSDETTESPKPLRRNHAILRAGLMVPTGELNNRLKMGFGFDVIGKFSTSNPYISIATGAGYTYLPGDTEHIDNWEIEWSSADIFKFVIGPQFGKEKGLYFVPSLMLCLFDDDEEAFGVELGLGVILPLNSSDVKLNIGGRFSMMNLLSKDDDEISTNFFQLGVGIVL